MADNPMLFSVFFWYLTGFGCSLLLGRLLKPSTCFVRPLFAWICQFAFWTIFYSLLLLLIGRPICSAAGVLACQLILILVNNAKFSSLREPFLYQDYDYFLDVIRFPRLYLPFLGIKNFSFCVLGCLIAIGGFVLENAPANRLSLNNQAGVTLILLAFGLLSLAAGTWLAKKPVYAPLSDYKEFGFATFLYLYFLGLHKRVQVGSPFEKIEIKKDKLPHLLAIQSESFFDVRTLDKELSPQILRHLDQFQTESFLHGMLQVPAWGANTIRTEFAFLTAIPPASIEAHQFSPYRSMLSGMLPKTLPETLKEAGYGTICLHPWHGAFYGRKRLFPLIGFDKFLDIKAFSDCARSGAYTDDRCLAEKVLNLLSNARKPLFIFVISMENHGPLLPEKNSSRASPFRQSWRLDCPELPVYAEHLHHADLMLGKLHAAFLSRDYPVSLCFYGDHVPIMPLTYSALGLPEGVTPYFCWRNYNLSSHGDRKLIKADELSIAWLKGTGLVSSQNVRCD